MTPPQELLSSSQSPSSPSNDEVQQLRTQVERLSRDVLEMRHHYSTQVAALAFEVQWLRAHLGGIGQAIREELNSLNTSSTPPPSFPMPPWASAATSWPSPPVVPVHDSKPSRAEAVAAALCAQIAAGGTGATACVEVSSPASEGGHELMNLLRAGFKKENGAVRHRGDPLPLSLDEFCLWQMQAREDAEVGADVRNAETFGADAKSGWSFEDNLAANLRLTQGQDGYARADAWRKHRDSKVRASTESTAFGEGDAVSITSTQSSGSGSGAAALCSTGDRGTRRRRRGAAGLVAE